MMAQGQMQEPVSSCEAGREEGVKHGGLKHRPPDPYPTPPQPPELREVDSGATSGHGTGSCRPESTLHDLTR